MGVDLLISTRRQELGLTLEDIAQHVGVSKSTVKKWESGYIKNMKRDKMSLLAEILKISPIALLNDKSIESYSFSQGNIFSSHEISLIKKYRALDEAGRELVDSMIDKLHEQHSSKSAESSSETTAS